MAGGLREPVAIVGMGCRFPGASGLLPYWRFLAAGGDAIGTVPSHRWEVAALPDPSLGRGGFLPQIDSFDWRAFRMLPREVRSMDPQQRLLLEVAWEAFEDAGLPLAAVRGGRGAVFVGVQWNDYLQLLVRDWSRLDGYAGLGNPHSLAANRLSFTFGLRGPSLAVDCGCASGLAAVHQACQSLWLEEADFALAGAVELMVSPESSVLTAATGMLSRSGRSRPLDLRADGFARGEGAAVLVLKPASKVLPHERVYALLRGVSVNHNGRNEWLVAASREGQRQVLEQAWQAAGIGPGDLQYVELHATGGLKGDRVEVEALAEALAQAPRTGPCRVGSVKAQIGHLGAASGLAALVKVALALFHGEIPPTVLADGSGPALDLAALGLALADRRQPWPAGRPVAGVTSLNGGGANAHAVLEGVAPALPGPPPAIEPGYLVPVSARTGPALTALAAELARFLGDPEAGEEPPLADVCFTAALGRSHHEHRLAVAGRSRRELTSRLAALAAQPLPTRGERPVLAWHFAAAAAGGSPPAGGRFHEEPAFAAAVRRCGELLRRAGQAPAAAGELPGLGSWIWQAGLAAALRDFGSEPDAVSARGAGRAAARLAVDPEDLEAALAELAGNPQGGAELVEIRTADPAAVAARGQVVLSIGRGVRLGEAPQEWAPDLAPGDEDEEWAVFLETLGKLYSLGFDLDWRRAAGARGRIVSLPTYPWQRVRLWPQELDPQRVSTPPELLAAAAPGAVRERRTVPGRSLRERCQAGETGAGLEAEVRETVERLTLQVLRPPGPLLPDRPLVEHGLDSLSAGELRTLLEGELGAGVPIAEVFHARGVQHLVEHCVAELSAAAAHQPPTPARRRLEPDRAARHQPFPLTDLQQAYWVGRLDTLALGGVGCHYYQEFESRELDLDRLERSFGLLIERHDMLRCIVRPSGEQEILATVPRYTFEVLDLRDCGPAAAEIAAAALRDRLADHVFVPDRWPLFAVRATKFGDGRLRVHLSFDLLMIDAESLSIMIQDWEQLYRDPACLAPLELSFRDYVLALEAERRSPRYAGALEYWDARLATLPRSPRLPARQSRPPGPRRSERGRLKAGLDAGRWEALLATARGRGLTGSSLLLAAFAEVLEHWSREARFAVNLACCRRLPLHPEVERLLGDFTSTIIVEVEARGETFATRTRQLHRQLFADLEQGAVSGVEVLRRLARQQHGAPATLAMPIVFTSLLGHARSGSEVIFTSNWLGEAGYGISQTPQVSLDCQLFEAMGGLVVQWDFVRGEFAAGVVEAMFAAYRELLVRLADGEPAWEARRPIDLPGEQAARRAAINSVRRPVPGVTLDAPFLEQAARHPERPAVVAGGRTLSYGELEALSRSLAHSLAGLRVRPNRLVAVVMEKGWEQVVAVLGILRAGAAYLPLEARLPARRLRSLLAQAEVEVALTQSRLEAAIDWPEGLLRLPVDGLEAGPGLPPAPAVPGRGPDDLAYVLFTSGSTGVPKGAMLNHRGPLGTILEMNRLLGVDAGDRFFGLSSLSFDLSVYDLFGALAAGAALVLPEPAGLRDPEHWLECIRESGVTVWNSVPTLMTMLAEHAGSSPRPDLRPLRRVVLSGDWIPLSLPERIRGMVEGAILMGAGGATETSIWNICHPIGEVDPSWASIPYGRPMTNQSYHVLDEELRPCPDGVPGTMYCTGTGLALGYWRDGGETARRFRPQPLTGERLYDTGDLGRYLPDGSLEILGREDFQVKIQGNRIELGEIEHALAGHPGVRAAVATAWETPADREKRLAVYVVPEGEADAEAWRCHLQERLPSYMVPHFFVPLAALPLGPNGKLDRRRLPPPGPAAARASARWTAVADATEALVVGAVQEVLGVKGVRAEDRFIDFGCTSVHMVRIYRALAAQLPRAISVAELFNHATVGSLAAALRATGREEDPPLAPEGVEQSAVNRAELARRRQLVRGGRR